MAVIEKEGFELKDTLFPQSQTFRTALKENKQHTFTEPCRYTYYTYTTNTTGILHEHTLNITHTQTHNTLCMPQIYRNMPYTSTYLYITHYSHTNTKYTHAHSSNHSHHRYYTQVNSHTYTDHTYMHTNKCMHHIHT